MPCPLLVWAGRACKLIMFKNRGFMLHFGGSPFCKSISEWKSSMVSLYWAVLAVTTYFHHYLLSTVAPFSLFLVFWLIIYSKYRVVQHDGRHSRGFSGVPFSCKFRKKANFNECNGSFQIGRYEWLVQIDSLYKRFPPLAKRQSRSISLSKVLFVLEPESNMHDAHLVRVSLIIR